jgi:hypothetical protein
MAQLLFDASTNEKAQKVVRVVGVVFISLRHNNLYLLLLLSQP